MLHELQRTALLMLAAIMAASIWLFPQSKREEDREDFLKLWWAHNPQPLRINYLDSLAISALPISLRARKSLEFRRTRQWYFTGKKALAELPAMDTLWIHLGNFDFTAPEKVKAPRRAFRPAPVPESKKIAPVDLNTADSLSLINIPGIGPWGAKSILREREQWGSIASLEQLKQKFPFDRGWDERWDHYLEVRPAPPRWSLNESPMDSLLEVPGFRYSQVKQIVFYRESFGAVTWAELATWDYWDSTEIDFFKLYISE
ncbi:MAG: helix-hairpin-helix domain-containing protein [Schleiferiaceae bacterium]